MFHSARLKLTGWYVLIVIIITVFFSVLVYGSLTSEVERSFRRDRLYIEKNDTPGGAPYVLRRPNPEMIQEVQDRVLMNIVVLDIIIVGFSAIVGYILAGITLRPIKVMMDEQNRFIADASHEIRTPLTAARTSIEVSLRDTHLSADAKEVLKSNLEDIINIQQLTDNLLILARNAGTTKKVFDALSLKDIMTTAYQHVEKFAKNKKITITQKLTNTIIEGNKDSLVQLFVTLLDNAIKYSEKNTTIKIFNRLGNEYVFVHIKDQGIGIEKEEIPRIFDRFYRSDKSRTKTDASGYGLGLSIAKKIVEEHNGEISVKSVLGKESIFTVKLPMQSV